MPTPFQMHQQRVREELKRKEQEKALDQNDASTALKTTEYAEFEILKKSLSNDAKALSGITQGDEKNAKRKELISRYMPHVEAYIEKGEEFANPVLIQVMLWMFDLFRIDQALKLAEIAIKQNQLMPENFKRTLPTFVADEVLEWSKNEYKINNSVEPYFTDTFEKMLDWPVPQVVKMKYFKFKGEMAFDAKQWGDAIEAFTKAEELETSQNKAAVKTKLATAKKELEKTSALKSDDIEEASKDANQSTENSSSSENSSPSDEG